MRRLALPLPATTLTIVALALLPALSPAPPALAQEAAPEGTARFQLERIEGGYARIDTATGEVSTCTERGDQLVCRMAADERSALMARMDGLEARIEALEATGTGAGAARLPSDAEIDRALGLMERFMRGFVGVVRDMEDDRGGERSG